MMSGQQGANTDSLETASPKGASYHSPGQRPGSEVQTPISMQALKGRDR